ncbi:MAG: hypothetical protein JSV88_14190 [Candidatus Aminicenantes bacterium]|nr:MAG: hypothetical protein JSV88_14190 [Candidatus Aminicenantes bacterium]
MPYEKISRVLSDEEIEGLLQDITNLDAKISAFAVNLSIKDRKTLYKMGDRSLPFVEQALKYAHTHKEFVPPFLNVEEFQKDWDLARQLKDLMKRVEPVMEKLSDTYMAAGADALSAALSLYDAVKAAAKASKPGSDVIVAELKRRYERKKGKTEEEEQSPNETES